MPKQQPAREPAHLHTPQLSTAVLQPSPFYYPDLTSVLGKHQPYLKPFREENPRCRMLFLISFCFTLSCLPLLASFLPLLSLLPPSLSLFSFSSYFIFPSFFPFSFPCFLISLFSLTLFSLFLFYPFFLSTFLSLPSFFSSPSSLPYSFSFSPISLFC